MENLLGFTPISNGELALCEVDGRINSMKYEYCNVSAFTSSVDNHPKINITRDVLHGVGSRDDNRPLFLPVRESFLKKLSQLWYEHGIAETLRRVSTEERDDIDDDGVAVKYLLKFTNILSRVHRFFQPYLYEDKRKLIAQYSQTRNWVNSPIRCISWHPHCSKLAVAASDDSVRIYSIDAPNVPVLKNKLQKNISCIAWRPLSSSEIAIGCESGILIWTVDPTASILRVSPVNSYLLSRQEHCPITDIVWSPRGEYLISSSVADTVLLVWDVSLDQTSSLRKIGSAGNTILSMSKDGRRMVAASTGLLFRIWDCKEWKAERWTTAIGNMQSVCWSPCNKIILFTTTEEPIIYYISMDTCSFAPAYQQSNQISTAMPLQAKPLLDVSRVELKNGQIIGGLIHSMTWDPNGRYLAVIFKNTNCVAIFSTRCTPLLQLLPSSLVNGFLEEYPCTMCFQSNFQEGSCLTIAWSSGRLQHFPLIYSSGN